MTGLAIHVDGLTVRIGSRLALDHVSFAAAAGTITVVVGKNGAGKTTALKAVAGLVPPSRGEIRIGGVRASSPRIHEARRSLGYMDQHPALYHDLTGREFLQFVSELYGRGAPSEPDLDRRLRSVELTAVANAPLRTYSTGMRRKVALLAAVIHEPLALVLDEPFVSLDTASSRLLVEAMLECRATGGAVLFSTHRLDLVSVADRVVVLEGGRLAFEGPIDELPTKHKPGAPRSEGSVPDRIHDTAPLPRAIA